MEERTIQRLEEAGIHVPEVLERFMGSEVLLVKFLKKFLEDENYEKLAQRMKEMGLKEEDYGFYMDLRKYGSTRHSGFGLGFERCIMYLTGMGNIRDVIPFPRTVNNCDL